MLPFPLDPVAYVVLTGLGLHALWLQSVAFQTADLESRSARPISAPCFAVKREFRQEDLIAVPYVAAVQDENAKLWQDECSSNCRRSRRMRQHENRRTSTFASVATVWTSKIAKTGAGWRKSSTNEMCRVAEYQSEDGADVSSWHNCVSTSSSRLAEHTKACVRLQHEQQKARSVFGVLLHMITGGQDALTGKQPPALIRDLL
ncbi:hypothetical protein BKA62DRAFT_761581 [Auriculariales sp. MPI-PUGE-AT-0066]|nr:hypothetical protein BKA62DRAFT_761581 [Auriculariales sp. MPI-PUGE-AT-0066]